MTRTKFRRGVLALVFYSVTLCQSVPPALSLDGMPSTSPTQLKDAVEQNLMDCKLKGDGKNTRHCQLVLQNNSNVEQRVDVPAFQAFIPEDEKFQNMMTTEDTVITVPPGETVTEDIPTVCVSTKLDLPPGEEDAGYQPGTIADEKLAAIFTGILAAAEHMEDNHAYESVPIPEERREESIAQLAIWKENGERTETTADDITRESIKEGILVSAGVQVSSLSKEQSEKLDDGLDNLFAAVDMTQKEGKEDHTLTDQNFMPVAYTSKSGDSESGGQAVRLANGNLQTTTITNGMTMVEEREPSGRLVYRRREIPVVSRQLGRCKRVVTTRYTYNKDGSTVYSHAEERWTYPVHGDDSRLLYGVRTTIRTSPNGQETTETYRADPRTGRYERTPW